MWNELTEVLLPYTCARPAHRLSAFGDEAHRLCSPCSRRSTTSGLAAPDAAVRRVELTPEDAKAAWPPYGHGLETAHGRVLLLGTNESHNGVKTRLAFEFSRDGQFDAVPGWKIVGEGAPIPGPGRARSAALEWPGSAGRSRRTRAAAERLSDMTGLSLLHATNVLTGLPTLAYELNGFPAELLTLLGTKQTELFAAGRPVRIAPTAPGHSLPGCSAGCCRHAGGAVGVRPAGGDRRRSLGRAVRPARAAARVAGRARGEGVRPVAGPGPAEPQPAGRPQRRGRPGRRRARGRARRAGLAGVRAAGRRSAARPAPAGPGAAAQHVAGRTTPSRSPG